MADRKYVNCNIAGEGKLYLKESKAAIKFKIIDMSAICINIETKALLLKNAPVKLKIRLYAGPVSAFIDLNGKVTKRIGNGYNIEFVDLSEATKEEIDELMRNSCDLDEENVN